MGTHETHMKRALELAQKGLGYVAPNPMVGCVIVHDGNIVAEGYHEKYGEAHAEPNAIKQVSDELLEKSTLYVTLEPCNHFGKTPPCSDLIISKKIPRVIVGCLDPNPIVASKGIKKLHDAGIQVEYGILEKECRELNKRFFCFQEKKRPYVILKWAQTQDGFISKYPVPENKEENWISSLKSKQLVHQWRAEEQAILVGYSTALNDNPQLTTRLVKGNNPIRIVIDKHLKLPVHLHVFNTEANTIVFNEVMNDTKANVRYIKIDNSNLVGEILHQCYINGISSIIVEGGAKTLQHFISQNLWDEARIFVNPQLHFRAGVAAPEIEIHSIQSQPCGPDLLYIIHN